MSLDERRADFEEFHNANPQVYRKILIMTRRAVRSGETKLGMKQIFEVLRWEQRLKTSGEPYKLNNNYTAFYARKIMDEYPDLEGIFEVRGQYA